MRKAGYYNALGLTPYWFAHVITNIVKDPFAYLRGLHELFSEDGHATSLCNAFPRWSNLHDFIAEIFTSIIHEDTKEGQDILRDFLVLIEAPPDWLEEIHDEGLGEIILTEQYESGVDRLVEEVFHILFRDVGFLAEFNILTATYISEYAGLFADQDDRFTKGGKLKRVTVPGFVRDAIYFRDGGECRSCKKSIDRLLTPESKEQYDHIIPLAKGGANDISNIQLLCNQCNAIKGPRTDAVSKLYPRVYDLNNFRPKPHT